MKIESSQLRAAILAVALREYADVHTENSIEYTFSETFRQKVKELNSKSQRKTWRCWNVYRRRVILIAIIVAILATLAACAPIIKELYIEYFYADSVEYFFVDHGTHYGITFDPEQAAAAPDKCETYYIPHWNPDETEPFIKYAAASDVTYAWIYKDVGAISYRQLPLPGDATNSTWMGIDAERSERSTRQINGYKVELFEDEDNGYLMALWTDNAYLYTIEICPTDKNSLDTVKEIMGSLVAVDPADYVG